MKKRRKRETEEESRKNADFLSFAAIVLALISYIMCCVKIVGMVFAAAALLMSFYALKRGGKKLPAVSAAIAAAVGIIFNIFAAAELEKFVEKLGSGIL